LLNLKYSNLKDKPTLFYSVTKLINHSFNYDLSNKFQTDFYPLVNQEHWENNHLILDQNDTVVGHIGARQKNLLINKHKVPITMLGGFCIHPLYRKRGIFKNFIQKVISHYQEQSALLMLWSDRIDFYRLFEFSFGMSFMSTSPDGRRKSRLDDRFHIEKTKFHLLKKDELKKVAQLYEDFICKKFHTIHRSKLDWENIQEIESTDLYLIKREQKIRGYFVKNKGQDLTNIVHEFAMTSDVEQDVCRYLKTHHQIWYPETYSPLNDEKDHLNYLALLRKGSDEKFIKLFDVLSGGDIKINKIEKNKVHFSFLKEDYIHSLSTFYALFFGPSPADEFKDHFKSWFISGLDSL